MSLQRKTRKQTIPKALREQVWIHRIGQVFAAKCQVPWCGNQITVFNFQCGHNLPESKGGSTTLDNLVPICSRCNGSMGNHYTIDEWSSQFASKQSGSATAKVGPAPLAHAAPLQPPRFLRRFLCCFSH